tara:strand:- start:84 stop:482 length:399 start_codon:yes stop_codon:yes gene_type:complete
MKVFSTNLRKAIAATIISPLAVIPAILIFTLISWLFDSDFVASDFEELPVLFMIILFLAYPLTAAIALPCTFLLLRFNLMKLTVILAIAVVAALIISLMFNLTFSGWGFYTYLTCSIAFLYWFVFTRVCNET